MKSKLLVAAVVGAVMGFASLELSFVGVGLSVIALFLIGLTDPVRPLAAGVYLTFVGVVGPVLLGNLIVSCGPPSCQYSASTLQAASVYLVLLVIGLVLAASAGLRSRARPR